MKASDYIARELERRGVRFVLEMSGGMIAHLLDSLAAKTNIRIVSMHHEQAAAFAADAIGRLTGIPGVAMATSGPGATNLLTGIGSCYFDSSPAVFITGQVNRYELRGDRAIRQLGFQETDIVSMAQAITKAAWQVKEIEDLPRMLDDAFRLATSGRPGPVLLDVPMDIQRADIEVDESSSRRVDEPDSSLDDSTTRRLDESLASLLSDLRRAKRPLILAGGGIAASRSSAGLRELARVTGTPVVTSLLARDVMPYDDPLHVGMIGSYGNRWANLAVGASDFLLVAGSRLDIRQTGSDAKSFGAGRVIHHVDVEAGEINNRVDGCHPIVAELRMFFDAALPAARATEFADRAGWLAEIDALRAQWPDTKELEVTGINPNQFMHDLSRASADAAAYVVDVGQHQMWAAQSLELQEHQRFITSGGMGSMGFALPASIGAALVSSAPVVVIAGDGGFQSNIQELQTIVRNRFPTKVVVINNQCHGMVRQFQEMYFEKRYQSTYRGYSAPDFARIAEAYGIRARTISTAAETAEAVEWLWSRPGEPALLQVMVDTFANAYPKIAFGRPMTEMEPHAMPTATEST